MKEPLTEPPLGAPDGNLSPELGFGFGATPLTLAMFINCAVVSCAKQAGLSCPSWPWNCAIAAALPSQLDPHGPTPTPHGLVPHPALHGGDGLGLVAPRALKPPPRHMDMLVSKSSSKLLLARLHAPRPEVAPPEHPQALKLGQQPPHPQHPALQPPHPQPPHPPQLPQHPQPPGMLQLPALPALHAVLQAFPLPQPQPPQAPALQLLPLIGRLPQPQPPMHGPQLPHPPQALQPPQPPQPAPHPPQSPHPQPPQQPILFCPSQPPQGLQPQQAFGNAPLPMRMPPLPPHPNIAAASERLLKPPGIFCVLSALSCDISAKLVGMGLGSLGALFLPFLPLPPFPAPFS
mmetsp:Transcript_38216/g.71184  ORF Transcript_38216/g.71184 Transcript_38216/m.71184 type:complete len:347 (+) Transcript_38216:498-1538(+)